MATAVIFTILIPVSLLLVLAMIVLSGSLSVRRRRLLERAIMFIMFPAIAALWAWRGVEAFREQDWIWVLGSLSMVVVMSASGAGMWRKSARPDGTRT